MPMKNSLTRGLITAISVLMLVQAPLAQAEIVDTVAVAPQNQAEQDRAKVDAFIERANVKERLVAMGVTGLLAKQRVESLSEAEVHALAQRIDTLPAGGNLSNTDLILVLLIAILVVVAL